MSKACLAFLFRGIQMIKENERFDLISKTGYGIIQNKAWFSYGIDAVLISHFAKVKRKDVVVDLGTGNGIIPVLIQHAKPAQHVIGIEKQSQVADMARRTIAQNNLTSVKIVESDILNVLEKTGKAIADVVISNPPYFKKGDALINEEDVKAGARHETTADLETFIQCASSLLKEKGHFYMVHRPMRLVDIIYFCRTYHLEPKLIQFVYPNQQKPPNIVLIKCVKNGNKELKYAPNLYVYEEGRQYSSEIYEIYSTMGIDVFEE